MIDISKINADWIENVSGINNNVDRILVDRVIHALLLLEGLSKQNIDFIFKGGTAVMLLQNSTKRLSIDIDIILSNKPDNPEDIFKGIIAEQGFNKFERQERKQNTGLDKEHFKFYYTPAYKTNSGENYILLDILYSRDDYTSYSFKPISSVFIPETGEPYNVKIPTAEDLIGDKLTAFAPNTTGIPYFRNDTDMSMEIIKQLYDIGTLFDIASDMKIINSTFNRTAQKELSYRDISNSNPEMVLNDIFHTALCISSKGMINNKDFMKLQTGIKAIKQFIFSENYQIEKAIVHASKAAYLTALIKTRATNIEKFNSADEIKDFEIKDPEIKRFNKLKKSNPEAFFYWYKVYELET
jgi:hypothetical protein